MWEIIEIWFNKTQKVNLVRDKSYDYVNNMIDSEIFWFQEKNQSAPLKSFDFYGLVIDIWQEMNTEVNYIINNYSCFEAKYIESLIRQKLEPYRCEVQQILEENIVK